MAVNINTVYQTVLALANKEQRGYITPQEFNLFAKMSQMQIFEQYFYDLSQFKRVPGNQSDSADMIGLIEDKINSRYLNNTSGSSNSISLPSDFYRIHSLNLQLDNSIYPVDMMERKRAIQVSQSGPLIRPTLSRPIAYIYSNTINILPQNTGEGKLAYYAKPQDPRWGYVVVDDKPLYSPGSSNNFDLHESEEFELIIKILQLAGVSIKDFSLAQSASQAEVNTISQQKQ